MSLRLPVLLSDHAVLQRDTPVHLWGWANPGSLVTIITGSEQYEVTTNKKGLWKVFIRPYDSGGPHQIHFVSGKEELIISDVFFGDVWVAGGQSNMEWKLKWGVDDWEHEVARSDLPLIRFFEAPKNPSYKKETDLPSGMWRVASPEITSEFSAVAWFFAKRNHLEKDVPVGIIDSTWGGTPAEAWTPLTTLLDVPGYKKEALSILNGETNRAHEFDNYQKASERIEYLFNHAEEGLAKGLHLSEYDDSDWKLVSIHNKQFDPGILWLRKTFMLEEISEAPALLDTGDIDQQAFIYINGEFVGIKPWYEQGSFLKVDTGILKKGENLIAIRAINVWDNCVKTGFQRPPSLTFNNTTIELETNWKYSLSVEVPLPEMVRYDWQCGYLYNGMIHPLTAFTIRGFLWYQGERNAERYKKYFALFSALIKSWRAAWNLGNLPFLFVQLAGFMKKPKNPEDTDWARLREAQSRALSLPNTGMAIALNIGAVDDIHPRNKKTVGHRLWSIAKKIAFNELGIHSGPAYKNHTIEGSLIRIVFDSTDSGFLVNGDTGIKGFAIAGPDKKFYWADAFIAGSDILVSSPFVQNPVAVRYGWGNNPEVNLYNKEGFPAAPFRTDNW